MKVIKMDVAQIDATKHGVTVSKKNQSEYEYAKSTMYAGLFGNVKSFYTDVVITIDESGVTKITADCVNYYNPTFGKEWNFNYDGVSKAEGMPQEWVDPEFLAVVDTSQLEKTTIEMKHFFGLFTKTYDAFVIKPYKGKKVNKLKSTYTCGVKIYE